MIRISSSSLVSLCISCPRRRRFPFVLSLCTPLSFLLTCLFDDLTSCDLVLCRKVANRTLVSDASSCFPSPSFSIFYLLGKSGSPSLNPHKRNYPLQVAQPRVRSKREQRASNERRVCASNGRLASIRSPCCPPPFDLPFVFFGKSI